jgi:hypothetical protein
MDRAFSPLEKSGLLTQAVCLGWYEPRLWRWWYRLGLRLDFPLILNQFIKSYANIQQATVFDGNR